MNLNKLSPLVTALVLLQSAACVSSAGAVESGDGSDPATVSTTASTQTQESPTSVARASGVGMGQSTCESFPHMQDECVWYACQNGTCLGIQMCWRMKPDNFPQCVFWDYPDPDMCCPDTAGQVVVW